MNLRFQCFVWLASLLVAADGVRAQVQEQVVVLPFATEWDVLYLFQQETQAQLNPEDLDADFLETWNTPAYDGPAFRTGVTAPISYGGITFFTGGAMPPGNFLEPAEPQTRGAVYFRKSFELAGTLSNIELTFLADDGFILYLDGQRWFSKNMAASAASGYREEAVANADENALITVTAGEGGDLLTSIPPGLHTLHLSLHNVNNRNSTDLGFVLSLVGNLTPPLPPPPPPVPALTASPATPSTDGSPRILLSATGLDAAAGYVVEASSDLTVWLPLGVFAAAEGRTQFTLDVPATAQRRFFRLANQSPGQ